MNFFDIILIFIIFVSAMFALQRGFVKTLIGLLCFVSSIYVASVFMPFVDEMVFDYSNNVIIVTILAAIISYVISALLFAIINYQLGFLAKPISGGVVDRFLGLILGVLRGWLICYLLYGMVAVFSSSSYIKAKDMYQVINKVDLDDSPNWIKNSVVNVYLENTNDILTEIVPNSYLKSLVLPIPENTRKVKSEIKQGNGRFKKAVKDAELEKELDKLISE